MISYEEMEDDMDELNQLKCCKYGVNCTLGQYNCIKEELEQVPVQWFPGANTTDISESLHRKLEWIQARNSSSNTIASIQDGPSTKQSWVSAKV